MRKLSPKQQLALLNFIREDAKVQYNNYLKEEEKEMSEYAFVYDGAEIEKRRYNNEKIINNDILEMKNLKNGLFYDMHRIYDIPFDNIKDEEFKEHIDKFIEKYINASNDLNTEKRFKTNMEKHL
jgi:hypothetical protein